jgi:AAA family ATP:ADP antiporter
MTMAMICGAAVTAQFIGGKATRDALFLTSLGAPALPTMLIAASVFSIVVVWLNAGAARRIAPSILVPASFIGSGMLFLGEWVVRSSAPSAVAVLVHLHVSAAGPLLASGFWLSLGEGFDPRTAKQRFGQIAAAGTLGGLLSGLLAERVGTLFGAPAMLPVLAGLQFLSAALVRRLLRASGAPLEASAPNVVPDAVAGPTSALRVLSKAPYLRQLTTLVLLGATGAALVDYLVKTSVVENFGHGDHLLRFFAIYYAVISLATFLIQTSLSQKILDRFGLAVTTSAPAAVVLAGGIGSLMAPGLVSLLVTQGFESIFRGSFFRAGYELFYSPIPAADRRAAKSLIDVAVDRLGDLAGGGLVRLSVLFAPASQSPILLAIAMLCSAGAIFTATRLRRGYVGSLENRLVDLSRRADASAPPDPQETSFASRTFATDLAVASDPSSMSKPAAMPVRQALALDADLQDIADLRSRDRARVARVLSREDGLLPVLVPHAIALLAWDPVAKHAIFALRKVAEEHVGQLVDALIDPSQDFAIRRRLARVFSVCVSQRAADGLLRGLDDVRFDVRYQCARSLAAILEKNPRILIDREQIFEVVLREVTVGRPIWESRRLLEGFDESDNGSAVDEFVRGRASQSLAHVFTLLALVLPSARLQMAFRGLQSGDDYLQGTALEYLDGVLPEAIRRRLWPFLEVEPVTHAAAARGVIAGLLRSNHSIRLRLAELGLQNDSLPIN